MRSSFGYQWPSYFYSGAIAIIVSWVISGVLSGCRFGNHVEQQNQNSGAIYYYETSPDSIEVCASGRCVNPNQVPAELSSIMSNPIALYVQDPQNGEAFFVSLNGSKKSLPVFINPGNELSYLGSGYKEVLWESADCTTQLWVEEEGKLTDSGPFTTGGNYPLTGRAEVTIWITRSFLGNCADSLARVKDCYLNESQCGGANADENHFVHTWVEDVFGIYVTAGAMTVNDIASVTGLGYKVSYK